MATTANDAAGSAADPFELESLKTTLLLCQGKMRRLETPKEELRTICEAIRHAVATDRMATDEEFRKFLHAELSLGIMQKMAKTMSFDQTYIEIVADTIEAMIDLFCKELQAGRYDEQFTCAMTWAFQPDCNLHKKNFQMSEDDLKRLTTARQKWRNDLKVGDQLDAQVWADDKQKARGWVQCRIERIEGDILSLVFPDLPADWDTDMDRWSTEIAEFETKTKEDHAWRAENLTNPDLKDFLTDMHDKFKWEEGTIFDIVESTESGRPVILANCGFRVYRTGGKKQREDERGIYDGWSSKYDEYIPVFSPRIQQHLSRVDGADLNLEEDDDEEDLDDIMQPEEGQKRIYCVPRVNSCISSKFISYMNRFGNNGGFDALLNTLKTVAPDNECTLTAMGYMITMISMPVKLFIKDWMEEFGGLFNDAIVKQLLGAPDKILKDVPAGDVNQIKSSVNSINFRVMDRDEARQAHERLHLEICKKCLASELLERRILGIKELNQVVRNASMTYGTAKVYSMPELITWMRDHEVFDILWDTKKTHLQLVQRSNEIFKALPKEDLLSMELLQQFWSLSKSDYKSEVFKIINEAAYHLKQDHIEYLFDQITETPAAKLGMEEFDALSGLGKFSSSVEFTTKTSNFFWNIITDSDEHKADLIENCIGKFADMIKFQSMDKKQAYFDKLVTQLRDSRSSAVPVIRLFKRIIKDQKQKASYSSSSYTGASSTTVGGTTVVSHGSSTTADGKTIYSKSYTGGAAPQESIYPNAGSTQDTEEAKEVTLTSCLNNLIAEHGLVDALLENLTNYCGLADQKIQGNASLQAEGNREKLFLMSAKHSHHDEVNERLSFLQEFAVNSDFKISKAQLKVIYDLLMQSPISSDFPEFLTWCNNACQAQTATTSVMDLEEVGEFFSELIKTKTLNLALLPVVGFDFLKAYFTSQNLEQGKLHKIAAPQKKKASSQGWSGGYYSSYKKDDEEDSPQNDDDPTVKILVVPGELTKIDMMWDIALQAQQPQVISKSIAFLVNCYISVDDSLEDRRNEILQSLNSRCFELIAQNKDEPALIKRLAHVLEVVIQISEKQGTGGVQPHNAILKGEMLDRIIVRYMVKNKQSYYGGLKLDRSLVFRVYTSATVWEFKKEVAQKLGLSTKYIKLTLPNKEVIKESQHGQTLQELNFKNGDILTAQKLSIVENIVEVPLVDRAAGCLVPRAREIFSEWFDLYKNKETGKMDAQCTATFISGATKAPCPKDDSRVEFIMKKYDTDKDGWMELDGFLQFYYDAITGTTLKAVQNNLKNHNVRLDLKKMSEVVEEQTFAEHDMPRFTLSANQDQFQALIGLLDRNDEASSSVWELVRMLATNQQMYNEVLSLSQAQGDGLDWAKVFEDSSLYKQIYKQEIIVAVMEASNVGADSPRVMFVEEQQIASSYSAYGQQAGAADADDDEEEKKDEDATQDATDDANAEEAAEQARIEGLKANWTKLFLEEKGFNYILSSILSKNVSAEACVTFSEQAAQKDTAFLMTLLRVFLKAGFSAQNAGIGKAIGLVRKSSSIADESSLAAKKDQASEDKLVALMSSPAGQEMILDTQFDQLLEKMLQILTVTASKTSLILEDKIIIENALSIVVGILMHNRTLYPKFVDFKNQSSSIANTEQLILAGLLNDEDKIRSDFLQSLYVISVNLRESENNALYLLLGILAKNFAVIDNKPSRQFFELFNKLIDLKAMRDDILGEAADDSSNIYNPEALLNQIIDKIKQQQKLRSEPAAAGEADAEDEVKAMELAAEQERLLVGLVTLTGKIIAKADKAVSDRIITEKDLIGQIFRDFLFASYYQAQMESNNTDAVVIQQKSGSRVDTKKQSAPNNKSREAAYELLHQLIKNSTTLMDKFLDDQLVPLIATIKKPKSWSYTPQTSSQREQIYVGLRNLGCICYMNSMMQQFFMVPALRYNLLCVDDGVAENLQEYKGDQIDDNMMHQMQKLLAHLELSERSEYNPKEFCFAFKEFDGAPTNTAEQKDAQEFLNLIFDRLENALKPTSRKHLVQGIFGGKQCSQMVCTECGKVKNRIEDYLNLSLPVKGVKSIEESLAKQVEGEIINDYQCDGCNRKVDLQKRTMIASTPNVLIVHLQRICFNFDTFQNDKINSFCEFPNVLDLKPYSFHEVMGKENRLKEQQVEEDEGLGSKKKNNEEDLTEEELAKKRELEAEAAEPERDDCYEYKLVGVNVHSGTANAGHYWSYINTNRGTDEKEGDTNWIKTEADTWMEFNDSRVSDWQFSELRQRTFGNEQKATQSTYFSSMGDSYGTSAYMLFYERRVKRDLKIVVEESQVEETKAKGVDVQFDEEKKEHFKMSPYRNAADGETANDIYQKVFDDNMKFTFESDIYSTEFFDFILSILQSVADTPVNDNTKLNGLKIGTKVGFEILARMMVNPGIEKVGQVMIDILKSQPTIIKPFIEKMCSFAESEVLWEVLLECNDKNAQKNLSRVVKFALCHLKMEEKELAMSMAMDTHTEKITQDDGTEADSETKVPKAVCVRFMFNMVKLLEERAPKNWRKFDSFIDIFQALMVNSAEEIATDNVKVDKESEAFRTGVELYYKYDMLRYLGDFVLQENSPYHEPGQIRTQMGGTYQSPNFSPILKTIIYMISDQEMMSKYPLNEKNQAIVSHKDILQKMIEPGEGSKEDFTDILTGMAKGNKKISKKMAKTYLKGFSKTGMEQMGRSLTQVRQFLRIDDDLKKDRIEWIFGVPQILTKPNFRTKIQQYGIELLDLISDEYCQFKCANVKGISDAFLSQLYRSKGRMDTQCVFGLRNLIEMCIEDDEIAEYIYNQPAPSLQYARYSDWFFSYAEGLKQQTLNQTKATTNMLEYHRNRLENLEVILGMRDQLDAKFAPMLEAQKKKLEAMDDNSFQGYKEMTLYPQVEEVIPSFPPAYIIGQISSDQPRVLASEDTDSAYVTVEEVSCEYMYSNPDGMFNLSVPEKMFRNQTNYQNQSYQSWKIGQLKARAAEGEDVSADDIVFKNWLSDKAIGSTLLKVMIKNKASRMMRIGLTLSVEDDEEKNVIFPRTELKENLFSNDTKQAYIFTKIDPSKESWGKISLSVNVKAGKTTQINSTGSYGYSSTGTSYSTQTGYYGYSGGVGTSTSYKPIGSDDIDSQIKCVNCDALCYAGEDYCAKCGKSTTEYDTGI